MSRKARVSLVKFVTFCFLSFYLSLSQAEVTLTVGKGSADPPATDSPVAVSLENQDERVKGLQVDVCDVGEYLTCTACETTDRTTDFNCIASEITNPDSPFYGCCRVLLYSMGLIIDVGEGPILTLKYDVSNGAPSGCGELTSENAYVADDSTPAQPLDVITEPGGFCFPCTSQADCNDGLYCTGVETCVSGVCQPGASPCTGGGEVCDERNDVCLESCEYDTDCADDNPCTTDSCHHSGYCQYDLLPDGSPCEDGLFCNGAETCDESGVCQPGTDPCPGQECDETDDECVECLDDADCDEGEFCDDNSCETAITTTTVPPVTTTTIRPKPECSLDSDCNDDNDCTIDECNAGVCSNTPVADGTECDDDLFCTVDASCVVGECVGTARDCDDGEFCTGVESCDEEGDVCLSPGDPCTSPEVCDEDDDVCREAPLPCGISIEPSSAAVESGETLSLTVTQEGDCDDSDYEWLVESTTRSSVDQDGNYTAGCRLFRAASDVVSVVDHGNGDITAAATITVSPKCTLVKIYGEHSEEVKMLRLFRDRVLSQTPEGREIIRQYYKWSPVIVKAMKEEEAFKAEIKALIDGILPLVSAE